MAKRYMVPGDALGGYINFTSLADHPRWMRFADANSVEGTAVVPSGFRRAVGRGPAGRVVTEYQVVPEFPACIAARKLDTDTGKDWRVIISDGSDHCIMSDGTPLRFTEPYYGNPTDGIISIPLVRPPEVRLTDSAPAKATVVYPIIPDAMTNPFSPSFGGWLSNWPPPAEGGGYGEGWYRAYYPDHPVTRGMELTVEYKDASTGQLKLAFRGRIFEIERSTEGIVVTAYDRIMDLATYSDQYTPTTLPTTEVSQARTISTKYSYKFVQAIGTIIDAQTYDRVEVDALAEMDRDGTTAGKTYIIPMPNQNGAPGYIPGFGVDSMKVRVKVSKGMGTATAIKVHLETEFMLLEAVGSGYACRAKYTQVNDYPVITSTHILDVTATGLGWTLPENAMIGLRYTWSWEVVGTGTAIPSVYIETSTSTYFTDHTAYRVFDEDIAVGNIIPHVRTSDPGTDVMEPSFEYVGYNYSHLATNLITIAADYYALVDPNDLPAGPSATVGDATLTTTDLAEGLWLVYYGLDAIDLLATAEELIKSAGLDVGDTAPGFGGTSYYTSSTYDYLTCIRELLKAGNLGIRDRINEAGVIDILPRHTLDETPVLEISTADATKENIITSHQITARWMAERATVAIIAEDATSSGLPIAMETDDELMDNSLADALDTPLRQVITDRSMGTHALLANAAGGRMVQLHTNVFEGQVVLAGYRLDVWDITGAGTGGQPIGVDIPEAGASGVALPTEVVFADGATIVKLDNIRTADRSEVANSMGLTADGVSNASTALPSTVYVFARYWDYDCQQDGGVAIPAGQDMKLLASDNFIIAIIHDGPYLKHTEDAAGYHHISGIIAGQPGTAIADTRQIAMIEYGSFVAAVDNPKYALTGQGVHVDLRIPKA